YTRDLVAALNALGVQITLITSMDAPVATDLPVEGYFRALPSVTPSPRASSLRLLASAPRIAMLTHDCDLVHAAAEPYALAAVSVPRLVVTAHGTYLPMQAANRVFGGLYRGIFKRSAIIAVSSYTSRQVSDTLPGVTPIVIPNGIDADQFQRIPAGRPEKH